MKEPEMVKVAEFLHRAVQISLTLQKEAGSKLLRDFLRVATEGEGEGKRQLEALAKDVQAFATSFPLPGITVSPYSVLGATQSETSYLRILLSSASLP